MSQLVLNKAHSASTCRSEGLCLWELWFLSTAHKATVLVLNFLSPSLAHGFSQIWPLSCRASQAPSHFKTSAPNVCFAWIALVPLSAWSNTSLFNVNCPQSVGRLTRWLRTPPTPMSHLSLKEMKLCKQILFSTFLPQPACRVLSSLTLLFEVVLGVLQADLELCSPGLQTLLNPAAQFSSLPALPLSFWGSLCTYAFLTPSSENWETLHTLFLGFVSSLNSGLLFSLSTVHT